MFLLKEFPFLWQSNLPINFYLNIIILPLQSPAPIFVRCRPCADRPARDTSVIFGKSTFTGKAGSAREVTTRRQNF